MVVTIRRRTRYYRGLLMALPKTRVPGVLRRLVEMLEQATNQHFRKLITLPTVLGWINN